MPDNDLNLRRLACLAQGGHQFAQELVATYDGYGEARCLACGIKKISLFAGGVSSSHCDPYIYLDTGSRFGRRT